MSYYKVLYAVMSLVAGQAMAQAQPAQNHEWKQCNEDVLGIRIDPAPVRRMLGAEFSPVLEEGMAQLAIMIQDCSQYWIDGKELGPNQMVHILVRIEGPRSIDPVVGAQTTEPTFTWFSLFAGSNNPRDQAARIASKTSPAPIEMVSLDPPQYPRKGSANINADLRIAWSINSAQETSLLMGVNHDVYVHDESGDTILKRVQAIGNLAAAPSPGVLEVEGDSYLTELIGAGSHTARIYSFFPIWARGTLGEELSE